MTGIAGVLGPPGSAPESLDRMLSAQVHRGPGGHVGWTGRVRDALAALGQNNRVGAPLQEAGGLPFVSPSGRYVLVLDGQIYNAPELRAELGIGFRTQADAELIVEALAVWGRSALARMNGEWALALLDREAATLLLARDPLGVKPLYVHLAGDALYFASEIKAILCGLGARFPFHPRVVGCFLEQTLLDAQPETFFEGVIRIPPAHAISVAVPARRTLPEPERYWSIPEQAASFASEAERAEAVRALLLDAVRIRASGDAKLGVLLSGGVDSSSVAAALRATRGSLDGIPVLSGVSAEAEYNDPLLDAMASHLACRPRRIPLGVPVERALEQLETVIWFDDEPVRSFVTVTEHRLKQVASQIGVTTLLSGLGADEVFCGHAIHLALQVQALLGARQWREASREVAAILWRRTLRPRFRRRGLKRYFPALLGTRGVDVRGPALRDDSLRHDLGLGPRTFLERQLADIDRLSLPALLHFDDRTGAAFGVETRLPYLDPRLVSLLAPMPPEWKLRGGTTKWMLRKAMDPLLPAAVAWQRVKQGAVDAYGEWLKKEMRGPIEALLASEFVSERLGILDRRSVALRYSSFCAQPADSGSVSNQDVFNPIAVELWARRFAAHLRAP